MPSRAVVALVVFLLPPVVLAADLARAFARGYQTSSSLWQGIAGICVLWIASGVLLVATPARRMAFANRGPRLALLSTTLVLAWLAVELTFGLLFAPRLAFHLVPPGTTSTFHPLPDVIRGIEGPSRYTANSLGTRGPEPPPRDAAHRVLCVGGSTTQCLLLDDAETWPQVAAAELARDPGPTGRAFWFGNAGQSGYGTWHHVRLMENEALLAQVDSVLFLCGINDLMRALQGRSLAAAIGAQPLYESSNVYRLIDRWRNVARTRRRHMSETADAAVYRERRQNRARGRPVAALPDLAAALAQYRENLATLADACARAGVRAVFATQPVLWREDLPPVDDATLWIGVLPDGGVPPTALLRDAMERFNAVVRSFCAERGLDLIDLAPVAGDAASFYDDCHFTEHGARRVGAIVAAWFRAHAS